MTDSEQDPWGIELVPLRTPPERREAAGGTTPPPAGRTAASNGTGENFDLVKLIAQLARTLDRVESRLARIERALKLEEPEPRDDPSLRRLRRDATRPPADEPPATQQ